MEILGIIFLCYLFYVAMGTLYQVVSVACKEARNWNFWEKILITIIILIVGFLCNLFIIPFKAIENNYKRNAEKRK